MKRTISTDLTFQLLSLILATLCLASAFYTGQRIIIETQSLIENNEPVYIYALVSVFFFLPMVIWTALMVVTAIALPAAYFQWFPFINRFPVITHLYDALLHAKRFKGEVRMYICVAVLAFALSFYLFIVLKKYNLFTYSAQLLIPLIAFSLPFPRTRRWSAMVGYAACLFFLSTGYAICLFVSGRTQEVAQLDRFPLWIAMILGIPPAILMMRILLKSARRINQLAQKEWGDQVITAKYKTPIKVFILVSLSFAYGFWFFQPIINTANRMFDEDSGSPLVATVTDNYILTHPYVYLNFSYEGQGYASYIPTDFGFKYSHEPGTAVDITIHNGFFGYKWIKMR